MVENDVHQAWVHAIPSASIDGGLGGLSRLPRQVLGRSLKIAERDRDALNHMAPKESLEAASSDLGEDSVDLLSRHRGHLLFRLCAVIFLGLVRLDLIRGVRDAALLGGASAATSSSATLRL